MAWFGKKKATEQPCCCGSHGTETAAAGTSGVKVLGAGCPNCIALEAAAVEALKQLGMDTSVDHVTDYGQIAAYGVMATPALVVDGKVVSGGRVLKPEEVVRLLRQARRV